MSRHRTRPFFIVVQLAGLALTCYWYLHLPAPGYAIGVLAAGAAVMSVQQHMRPWHKGLWLLFMGAFLFVEFRAIDKHEAEQQAEFAATMDKTNKIISGIHDNLDAVTGGDSFAEFGVVPNLGAGNPVTFPMVVMVYGKYPLRNVIAEIQTINRGRDRESLRKNVQSMHLLPLGNGTLLPIPNDIPERLGPGKYVIQTWSENGFSNESMELKLDEKGQLVQSYEVHKDGRVMVEISDDKLISRVQP